MGVHAPPPFFSLLPSTTRNKTGRRCSCSCYCSTANACSLQLIVGPGKTASSRKHSSTTQDSRAHHRLRVATPVLPFAPGNRPLSAGLCGAGAHCHPTTGRLAAGVPDVFSSVDDPKIQHDDTPSCLISQRRLIGFAFWHHSAAPSVQPQSPKGAADGRATFLQAATWTYSDTRAANPHSRHPWHEKLQPRPHYIPYPILKSHCGKPHPIKGRSRSSPRTRPP